MALQKRHSGAVLLPLLLLALFSCCEGALEARRHEHDLHHHDHGARHEDHQKQQKQADLTYWDLARRIVPQTIFTAFESLPQLSASSGPDDVKPLRISLLHAREALDIFSFAMPGNFSFTIPSSSTQDKKKGHKGQRVKVGDDLDLWHALRNDLDLGYEVLGDFQDLAHAMVEWNASDAQTRLDVCLQWLDTITVNRIRYGYDAYLAHIADGIIWKHHHISKLFWDYKHAEPSAELGGVANVVHMVRSSQVPQIIDNFTVVMEFQHVYQEPDHARFHLFRKLIRSLLAVLEFFPQVLPPSSPSPKDHHHHHEERRRKDRKHEHRRGASLTLGGAQEWDDGDGDDDEGDAAMSSTSISTSRRLLHKGGGGKGLSVCDPPGVVANLQSLFKNLGQVNNQVFAYEFYEAKGMAKEADDARQACDAQWSDLRKWMLQVKLLDMVQCLSDALIN